MRAFIFIVIAFFASILPVRAEISPLTAERVAFLQAKSALAHGNQIGFKLVSSQLHDYVLYPYLQYAAINQQLNLTSEPDVNYFLKAYPDTPLNDRLRTQWLTILAQKQRWQTFFKYYQPATTHADLQCYYAQALWQTQQRTQANNQLTKIWLSKNTLPNACTPILKNWQAAGYLTSDLAWQRVRFAMQNNQPLEDNIWQFLPPLLALKAKFWQEVHKSPELVANPNLFVMMDNYLNEILIDGIQRLAVKKPQQVAALWPSLQNNYDFSREDSQLITRAIAIELARSADPAANDWLIKIKPAYENDLVKLWRIRVALAQQNWPAVKNNIQALPAAERSQSSWQYWYARALMQTGQAQQAQVIYRQLAQQVDYYGLLASQQLRIRYQPASEYINNKQAVVDKVLAIPAVQRSRELYALHMLADSRREWQWATKEMDPAELHVAAQLAAGWNWFDRALMTAAKAKDFNNITARFPLAYRQQVIASAQQRNLDPAWVLAIMRQESAFIPDAKSGVGALGLMQLMPHTARILNARLEDSDLLNSSINISLGSHYLKQLYDDYNRNEVIATAAYNVGPTRLQKWLPLYKKLPADIWIDILPWQETRNYVQTVSLATAIYQQRLQGIS